LDLKQQILSKVSQEEIMKRYFPHEVVLKTKRYCNPFRPDDKTPDCTFKYTSGGRLVFVDYADTKIYRDCFDVVMDKFSTDFIGALTQVSIDFELGLHKPRSFNDKFEPVKVISPIVTPSLIREPEYSDIRVCTWDDYSEFDLKLFGRFAITEPTLKLFDVKATDKAWINGNLYHVYSERDPMYRYREGDCIKLYRPLADKTYKWRSNFHADVVEGYNQLPKRGKILFITKSRKDVMTLYELGIPAISPRSENTPIPREIMLELKERFDEIYVNYDNDETGVKYSIKLTTEYDLKYWNIPKQYEEKDPSDFVETYGKYMLYDVITQKVKI
jgi:hypothetical protein